MKIRIENEFRVVDYDVIEIVEEFLDKNNSSYVIRGTVNGESVNLVRFKEFKDCVEEFNKIIECNNIYVLNPNKNSTIKTNITPRVQIFNRNLLF